jgi:hypothetical protein
VSDIWLGPFLPTIQTKVAFLLKDERFSVARVTLCRNIISRKQKCGKIIDNS